MFQQTLFSLFLSLDKQRRHCLKVKLWLQKAPLFSAPVLPKWENDQNHVVSLGSPFCLSKLIFPVCHTKEKERKKEKSKLLHFLFPWDPTWQSQLPSRDLLHIKQAAESSEGKKVSFQGLETGRELGPQEAGVRPSLQGPPRAHLIQHLPCPHLAWEQIVQLLN